MKQFILLWAIIISLGISTYAIAFSYNTTSPGMVGPLPSVWPQDNNPTTGTDQSTATYNFIGNMDTTIGADTGTDYNTR